MSSTWPSRNTPYEYEQTGGKVPTWAPGVTYVAYGLGWKTREQVLEEELWKIQQSLDKLREYGYLGGKRVG